MFLALGIFGTAFVANSHIKGRQRAQKEFLEDRQGRQHVAASIKDNIEEIDRQRYLSERNLMSMQGTIDTNLRWNRINPNVISPAKTMNDALDEIYGRGLHELANSQKGTAIAAQAHGQSRTPISGHHQHYITPVVDLPWLPKQGHYHAPSLSEYHKQQHNEWQQKMYAPHSYTASSFGDQPRLSHTQFGVPRYLRG